MNIDVMTGMENFSMNIILVREEGKKGRNSNRFNYMRVNSRNKNEKQ